MDIQNTNGRPIREGPVHAEPCRPCCSRELGGFGMSLIRWSLSPFGALLGFFVASVLFAAVLGFVGGLGVPNTAAGLSYGPVVGILGGIYGFGKTVGLL